MNLSMTEYCGFPQDIFDLLFNDSKRNCSSIIGETDTQPEVTEGALAVLVTVVANVLYAITFLVGLSGNTLVIYVVARFSKMQTVTNLYILNLAIADELFVLSIPFLMVTSWVKYWPFGAIMCKMYMITTSLNQFTSSLFLTIMSADRYIAVCHPISAPKFRTPMISKLVSLTAWTLSALMIVPVFMYANTMDLQGKTHCNIIWPGGNSTWRELGAEVAFTQYSFAMAFGIPLCLIFIFYALVLRRLRLVGPRTRSKEKKRSRQKVTRLVFTVITVYILCWLPYWILQLILIRLPPRMDHHPVMHALFMVSSCLSYLNSALNPVLYAFLSDNFKKSFMKACTCTSSPETTTPQVRENSVITLKHRGGVSLKPRAGGCRGEASGEGSSSQGVISGSTALTTTSSRNGATGRFNNSEKRSGIQKQSGQEEGPLLFENEQV